MSNSAANVINFKRTTPHSSTQSTSQTQIEFLNNNESTVTIEQQNVSARQIQALFKKLNKVFAEAKTADWDGDGAEAISDAAYFNATRLLSVLPTNCPQPDIIADNDGFIELEWSNNNKNFSIYITDTNLVLYAGYYGEYNRLSGRFNYEGFFPRHAELLAREVYSEGLK